MSFKIDNPTEDQTVAEINMTPLIDIMLVLLIIFMVTTSVALESGLDIDLPKTKSQTKLKEGTAVLVSLTAKGEISVQGKKTNYEQLIVKISEALKESSTDLVVFEGDRVSKLEDAIKIMDVAKAAGAVRFAIATETSE